VTVVLAPALAAQTRRRLNPAPRLAPALPRIALFLPQEAKHLVLELPDQLLPLGLDLAQLLVPVLLPVLPLARALPLAPLSTR